MKKLFFAVAMITLAMATFTQSNAQAQSRDCAIVNGQRVCSGGGGGGYYPPPNLPPQRPPPQRPPNYYPPTYPPYYPPVYNPRPPVYYPPVYYPPQTQPSFSRVQQLVWNLESWSTRTLNDAEMESSWNTDSQQQTALWKLQQLANDVRLLREQVGSYSQYPGHTSYNYRNVKSSFEAARESLFWAHFSSRVDSDFDEVERTIFQLDSIYWGY
jgi:hypothetical protein